MKENNINNENNNINNTNESQNQTNILQNNYYNQMNQQQTYQQSNYNNGTYTKTKDYTVEQLIKEDKIS